MPWCAGFQKPACAERSLVRTANQPLSQLRQLTLSDSVRGTPALPYHHLNRFVRETHPAVQNLKIHCSARPANRLFCPLLLLSKRQKELHDLWAAPPMSCPPAAAVVSLGKDGLAASASRDPQGGAGEKDVLEAVVTRHKLHREPVPARLHLISDRVASVPPALKI